MYQPVTLILKQIKLEPVPILNGGQGSEYINKHVQTRDSLQFSLNQLSHYCHNTYYQLFLFNNVTKQLKQQSLFTITHSNRQL